MALLNMLGSISVSQPSGMWEPLLILFDFVTNYGWRVILFTVLLKLVLSPLDFFQRYKMKKNQRITEKLKPEMDRLKKQYGNDTRGMQQAQMKLQKSMGFSYLASCLPMIITLVVFFTFFAGMRNISQYEEFKQYVGLYEKYSERYTDLTGLKMVGDSDQQRVNHDDGDFIIKIDEWAEENDFVLTGNSANEKAYAEFKLNQGSSFNQMYSHWLGLKEYVEFFTANRVSASDPSIYDSDEGKALFYSGDINGKFNIDAVNNSTSSLASVAKGEIFASLSAALESSNLDRLPFVDFEDIWTDHQKLAEEADLSGYVKTLLSVAEVLSAENSYQEFKNNSNARFLWVKSLWVPDVPTKKAVRSYSSFRSGVSKYMNSNSNAGKIDGEILADLSREDTYNKVMLKIKQDKDVSGTNGYFIMAIIAVGLTALSQFITTRQQKKSGQVTPGMSNNTMKIMMLMMPVMVGVFAITSTAAFSVYMITNSAMSLVINLISGGIIKIIFKKQNKDEMSDTGVVKYGRRDPNDFIDKRSK